MPRNLTHPWVRSELVSRGRIYPVKYFPESLYSWLFCIGAKNHVVSFSHKTPGAKLDELLGWEARQFETFMRL